MKKKQIAALALAAGAGAWCIRRDRKYPVRRELRFANKLVCPGWAINLGTARLSNRLLDWMPLPAPPQGVESRGIQVFSEDGTPVRLTRYRPKGLDWAAPCLVYFHGGGFCMRDAGYIHRYAALRWVWDNAPKLRIDRARIAVGGDSAGGALAAACALRSRDEGGPQVCFQLLVYPVTDCRMETDSMQKYTDSPMWNAGPNQKMWELYLRNGDHGMPQYVAPLLAHDFSNLPPPI